MTTTFSVADDNPGMANIAFDPPETYLKSRYRGTTALLWELKVRAGNPGMDYSAKFVLPAKR